MKFLTKYIGLGLILAGVALLVTLHVLHVTFVNMLLLIPLFLIVSGIVCHIWAMKCQSNY